MSERFRSVAVVTSSLVLLAVALHGSDPRLVWAQLAAAKWRWLALAVLLDAGVFLLKSAKWRFLFRPLRRLPLATFFSGIAVGALANAVLPLRLDELVRTFYFGTRTGVRKATVLGTILVERLVDVSLLLLALLFLGTFPGGGSGLPIGRGLILSAACLGGGSLLVLASRHGIAWLRSLSLPGPALASGFSRARDDLAHGLEVLGPGRIAGALGFAGAEWGMTLLHVAAVLRAFDVHLSFVGTLTVVSAGYLGFALPSAPGALGVYDLLVKTSLVGFGVEPATALSCALTLHALLVVPISLAGAVVLVRDGLSLSRLRRLAAADSDVLPAHGR